METRPTADGKVSVPPSRPGWKALVAFTAFAGFFAFIMSSIEI